MGPYWCTGLIVALRGCNLLYVFIDVLSSVLQDKCHIFYYQSDLRLGREVSLLFPWP